MSTRYKIAQRDADSDFESVTPQPSSGQAMTGNGNGYKNQASGKGMSSEAVPNFIEEVKGTNDANETETFGKESTAETLDNHLSMSNPITTASSEGGATDESAEETDTESSYEDVEGWQESHPIEAGEEAEPVIEAFYASLETTEGGQEFFGAIAAALGPLIMPLAKTVLPSLAGAAVTQGTKIASSLIKQGVKRVNPQVNRVISRLRQLGVHVPANILSKLEASEEFTDEATTAESAEVDQAAMEALAQQLEVIIGTDDRVQVNNTNVVPWKRICHLKITAGNGKSFLGTGFFIGPRTIITAGHCVYLHGQGGWAKQIVVTPARNGSSMPFGSFTSKSFRSVRGWVQGQNRDYDYGCIILSKNDSVSSNIGAFGFGEYPDQFLLNKRLNTAGYPGDKRPGTMWFNGRKAKSVTARTIIYEMDTVGGQSGSPVWFKGSDGSRIAVGIHTNGAISGNSATRISKPVLNNLKNWRLQGGTTY